MEHRKDGRVIGHTRPRHLTTRGFQGPYRLRFWLWLRTRRQGALLLAPFRVSGRGASSLLECVTIGRGTRIGQLSWFSLVSHSARIRIGDDCTIGPMFSVSARESVVIGDGTTIAERCLISDHGHDHAAYLAQSIAEGATPKFGWQVSRADGVAVGAGVHIGVNVTIMPGVQIGEGAVVGANSVVTRSVEPFTVVAGVPAKPLRSRPLGEPSASEPGQP